jgi:6-phosphogluconolactonase (cycloisomerase 2 family)
VRWIETRGKTPRFFTIDASGRHLFVANEDSDTIVRFDRDAERGVDQPNNCSEDRQPNMPAAIH